MEHLTARESQVLEQIAQGLTNESIANRLGMAEGTARVHTKSILRKLGVNNRTQAALQFMAAKKTESSNG